MSVLLRDMITGREAAEYLVINRRFSLIDVSPGAARFGAAGLPAGRGNDVRDAFPELAGIEEVIHGIISGENNEWSIRNVSRTYGDSGLTFDITLRACPPPWEENVVLLLTDVTERSRYEQALLQQSNDSALLLQTVTATRNFLDRVFNALADGLCVVNPDGFIRTANDAASALFGFHPGELLGMKITEILPSIPAETYNANIRRMETTARNKEGTLLPVGLAATFVPRDETFPDMTILLLRDLRTQKEAEREISRLKAERSYLLDEVDNALHFHGIVGASDAMKAVFRQIEQVAKTDSTVLLLGETGTGKELAARAIHTLSSRRDRLLVKVNCAVFQSTVVESELFGHEKGAFTGATSRRVGRFEFANGGSLLLDEVGELPLETQAKLLRVLQEQEFERVGGSEPVGVDVRVIAATNKDLEEAVSAGTFRDDLYFRINVFPIHIPSLRERKEDIPLLAEHFLVVFNQKMNKHISGISTRAINELVRYDWPGNVRELSSVIERAVILCNENELRDVAITPPKTRKVAGSLKAAEREHILSVLKKCDGQIEGDMGAAVRLGINPSTLRSRMKRLGIRRPYNK